MISSPYKPLYSCVELQMKLYILLLAIKLNLKCVSKYGYSKLFLKCNFCREMFTNKGMIK